MGIDIRDHGGSFGGLSSSPWDTLGVIPINGSSPRGAVPKIAETIRYFLAISKSYVVGFIYNTTSGNTNVCIFDRKTMKIVSRLASHSSIPANYVSYDSIFAGMIIDDKWLIHPSYGTTKMSKRDLKGTASSIDLPTADGFTHTWVSPDTLYGYAISYGKVVKYDSNGNEVWVCTAGLTGGYRVILGEWGDYLYVCAQGTYMTRIHKNTGVQSTGTSGYNSFPGNIMSGFISGDKIVLHSTLNTGAVTVHHIDSGTGIPTTGWTTQKSSYCLSPVPVTSDKSKILIGRPQGATQPVALSDLYDVLGSLGTPIEEYANPWTIDGVRHTSNSEVMSIGTTLNSVGSVQGMSNAYFIFNITKGGI